MATGDRISAFVVATPNPSTFSPAMLGEMLLKIGSYRPTLEMIIMKDRSPVGQVWTKSTGATTSGHFGKLQGKPVRPHLPCAIAYEYDAIENRAELLVNGVSQGLASAPVRIEQHDRSHVGFHPQPHYAKCFLGNFFGDMYEVIVYDTILKPKDRDRVFEYLRKRYEIPQNQ
jgi:hypothetical protein